MLAASKACADEINVSWQEPMDFGTVPATDADGVYVGPDYVGGQIAGLEEVAMDATGVVYEVQRMVQGGGWTEVAATGMSYKDEDVAYGNTYSYRVRAMNSHGLYSPWKSISETLVEPDSVNAPSNLRATLNEEGQVILQWTAPIGGNQDWFDGDDADTAVDNGDASTRLSYRIERVDANNADTGYGEQIQAHQYGPRSFEDPRITHEQTRTDAMPHDGVGDLRGHGPG